MQLVAASLRKPGALRRVQASALPGDMRQQCQRCVEVRRERGSSPVARAYPVTAFRSLSRCAGLTRANSSSSESWCRDLVPTQSSPAPQDHLMRRPLGSQPF